MPSDPSFLSTILNACGARGGGEGFDAPPRADLFPLRAAPPKWTRTSPRMGWSPSPSSLLSPPRLLASPFSLFFFWFNLMV
uniref:Uncharacterized protein n=1 Tax=Arundo donax TaxID=35708 RepID=A0A0A8XQR0_ARUDO